VLTIGHENNHQGNNIVTKFRNICNQCVKNEHIISLRIIYNEVKMLLFIYYFIYNTKKYTSIFAY